MAKKTAFSKAKAEAVVGKESASKGSGLYDGSDVLKHYIRTKYWLPRIKTLQRDNQDFIRDGVKYFSFCSKFALDVRLLMKRSVINVSKGDYSSFAYVEFDKRSNDVLTHWLQTNPVLRQSGGVLGALAEVATDTTKEEYAKFWNRFPFDVINLDYLGDIFRTGQIGANDFYAIQAIVNRQSFIRRPYELWVTLRAKDGRFEQVVKSSFRGILKNNLEKNSDFKAAFEKRFPGKKVNELPSDDLFLYGFIKWMWYVCVKSDSTLSIGKLNIVSYTRKDKDGVPYTLYNVFLRITPYEDVKFPSPIGDAATHCQEEYDIGVPQSLIPAKSIDQEFADLSPEEVSKLTTELDELMKDYRNDTTGILNA